MISGGKWTRLFELVKSPTRTMGFPMDARVNVWPVWVVAHLTPLTQKTNNRSKCPSHTTWLAELQIGPLWCHLRLKHLIEMLIFKMITFDSFLVTKLSVKYQLNYLTLIYLNQIIDLQFIFNVSHYVSSLLTSSPPLTPVFM